MKKLSSILLAVIMFVATAFMFAVPASAENCYSGFDGNGTEASPYKIQTAAEWENFVSAVNNDADHGKEKYFRLESDLGSQGNEVTASVNEFSGDFNGNGKTVCYSNKKQSVFQKNNGIIHDLTICGSVGSPSGHTIGGICKNNTGRIDRCVNRADIIGVGKIGGICGSNGGVVTSCINYGEISKSSLLDVGSGYGGICGECTYNGIIANCINTASVTGYSSVAGICGIFHVDGNTHLYTCFNCGLPTSISDNSHLALYWATTVGNHPETAFDCYYIKYINGIKCEASNPAHPFLVTSDRSVLQLFECSDVLTDGDFNRAAQHSADALGIDMSYWKLGEDGLPVLTNRTTANKVTGFVFSVGSLWIFAIGAVAIIGCVVAIIVASKKRKKTAVASGESKDKE